MKNRESDMNKIASGAVRAHQLRIDCVARTALGDFWNDIPLPGGFWRLYVHDAAGAGVRFPNGRRLELEPRIPYLLPPFSELRSWRNASPEQLEAALKLQASSLTDTPNLQVPDTRTSVPIGFDGYNGDLTGDVAATLGVNCGMSTGRNGLLHPVAFAANQRDEVRDLHDVAGALGAQPGIKQQTFIAEGVASKGNGDYFLTPECNNSLTAGFSAGAGASAGGIGYHEELAPTLKGSASGNCMPSVLCLNDQGGSVMEVTEDRTGTLRAQEHGHQPLVYENHGIDARYTGPHTVAPTMSARYGTGGNNVPLVEQESVFCITGNAIDRKPENGGNGIGYQEDISYTLTATDHHAVFSRQRVDVFKDGKVVSTQSARQHKDATDLVLEEAGGPYVPKTSLHPCLLSLAKAFLTGG